MAKKFKVMASNAKEPDGKCIPKSMRKSVESACGKKKAVKADWASNGKKSKIFKSFEIDDFFLLELSRDFIGVSINNSYPNGTSWIGARVIKCDDARGLFAYLQNELTDNATWNQIERTIAKSGFDAKIDTMGGFISDKDMRKPIKSSKDLTDPKASYDDGFADMLQSVRYNLRFDRGADLIFDNRVISSNKRDIGHLLDKYNVNDVIVDVDRDRAGKRDLQRMQDLGFEIQDEFLGETPSNPELPPHDVYRMVRNKKSVKSGKVLFPWAMVGRFADGYTCEVSGDSEADCIEKLGNMQNKHGELEYYSGVDDDDYDADGRRIYSSRTKRFGVKASKDAKKRVAAAKGAKQEYISKEFVNLANDPYLQTAYDSNNLTVSLINGDTILIIAEGPNRTEIERKAKAVAKKIYPQYELYGDTKRYKDVPRDDIKSACKTKKTVKASAAAKKRKAIKASGITDDIVIYFNGDNVYQGSIYDMADAIENLCYDDEVNAKFQEWCNQFGDPFDFDGSPIDTARVFTDIIIYEAEEAPMSEDDKSEFYVDGNGILDFEILYADDIYGAKSIKCSSSDNYNDLDETMRFRVCSYYDTKFRDLAECKVFDDFDEAIDYAHECLGNGPTTIEDYYVGTVEINPDEYWDNFDGEFWCTPELADFRDKVWKSMGIGASKNVNAGITVGEDDRYDFSNPIYELDDYVKALADGTVNQVQGITYDISKETIAFFDEDNNVVFVQPIGGIIPEPDDLETDIYELSSAIKSEMDSAYGRENWEQDEDDPDYASRAVEFSTDVKAAEETVDIDDLEYVTGEDDEPADMGYGYDSNGDPIDESTVEELYRIAEYEILPKSELAKIDEYVSIDEDSWDFYMSSPHVTEKFYIHFELTEEDINFNDYTLPDGKMFPDFNYYTAVLDFDIYAENGEITSVILEDKKIYRPDGAFDDYDVKQFDDLYNVEALINYVEHLAADTVKDIYNGTTNL